MSPRRGPRNVRSRCGTDEHPPMFKNLSTGGCFVAVVRRLAAELQSGSRGTEQSELGSDSQLLRTGSQPVNAEHAETPRSSSRSERQSTQNERLWQTGSCLIALISLMLMLCRIPVMPAPKRWSWSHPSFPITGEGSFPPLSLACWLFESPNPPFSSLPREALVPPYAHPSVCSRRLHVCVRQALLCSRHRPSSKIYSGPALVFARQQRAGAKTRTVYFRFRGRAGGITKICRREAIFQIAGRRKKTRRKWRRMGESVSYPHSQKPVVTYR